MITLWPRHRRDSLRPSRDIRRNRCKVTLRGFVDESGSSDGNVYVLAGFVSTPSLWESFSREWVTLCEQDPKTPDFHMKKAIRLKEYRWDQTERDKRLRDLTGLIRKRARFRVDAVTAHPDYEHFVRGKIPVQIDDPYFVLFYNVILAMAEFMDLLNLRGTVEFVFDRQNKGTEQRCAGWYPWIRDHVASRIKQRLGTAPIFRHDKDVMPLKAADLFAWHIRRHLNEEQPRGVTHGDILDSLMGMHGISCNVRGEDLENLVSSVTRGLSLRSHAEYFLPYSEELGRNLRKRKLSIKTLRT
jgi:Protein of unknown function (DUF3800)